MSLAMSVDDDPAASLSARVHALQALLSSVSTAVAAVQAQREQGGDAVREAAARSAIQLQFLQIKQLHRAINVAAEDVRRQGVMKQGNLDDMDLQLQGLAYEKAHLTQEIATRKG